MRNHRNFWDHFKVFHSAEILCAPGGYAEPTEDQYLGNSFQNALGNKFEIIFKKL